MVFKSSGVFSWVQLQQAHWVVELPCRLQEVEQRACDVAHEDREQ